jgi:hypothetical protein
LPRVDKWLPFFEEVKRSRSTATWKEVIEEQLSKWGMKIKDIVSNRARALVKLGDADELNVPSMPDLFHFAKI